MKAFALTTERLSCKEVLREGVRSLQAAHIESASLDARLLLEHALGFSREQLLFRMEETISPNRIAIYRDLIDRRSRRQPVAQIIGRREFFGLSFKVTPAVLDPRPDSETLIETVLRRVRDRKAAIRILDLGTGTGCLLLTLLYEFPYATGVGVDISDEALKVAQGNALNFGLQNRADFVASHWCMRIEDTFDIIVSNPPYIATGDIGRLAPEVANWEPKLALDGGIDGLACYRAIMATLPHHLNRGGIAVLELGMGQLHAVETLAQENGLTPVGVGNDLQGISRCLIVTH